MVPPLESSDDQYLPKKQSVAVYSPKKKVIVIAGPTASRKTELSIKIAQAIGGEIISSDSMQIYRGMDIGTAKATQEELSAVPHHMIDIQDPSEIYNVVKFYEAAHECMQDIFRKNKVPIIVGGVGFYIHSFIYGPPQGPPSIPEVRNKLEEDLEKFGAEFLYEKLQLLDPTYASTITILDKHKIIRALEIISITGKKVSDIPKPSQLDIPNDLDFRCWFNYFPTDVLYKRIEERCDKMLQEGLLDEVARLREEGLEQNTSASMAIGYRQSISYLDSKQTEEDYKKFVHDFKKASKRYARRQFTWFRKEPLFRWLDLSQHDLNFIMELIIQDYEQAN